MIDESLLKILQCPKTGEELELVGDKLVSKKSKIEYQIKDGIPILLTEDL